MNIKIPFSLKDLADYVHANNPSVIEMDSREFSQFSSLLQPEESKVFFMGIPVKNQFTQVPAVNYLEDLNAKHG